MMQFAKALEGFDGPCHDFADVFHDDMRMLAAVADGAGTTGDVRARLSIGCFRTISSSNQYRQGMFDASNTWSALVAGLDLVDARAGECTAAVASMTDRGIVGASVGDSGAWLVRERDFVNLTENQRRKPLLGSGEAVPIAFSHPSSSGTLLVASDGLFNYAAPHAICDIARGPDLDAAAKALIDLVRLRNGKLQDDVAVVLCRV
jgi:serine/threonine protein phosphatase PrpC